MIYAEGKDIHEIDGAPGSPKFLYLLKQLKEEEMMMHSSDQIENPEVIEEDDPNIWRPRFTSNRTIKYICDFVEYCKSYIM